MTIERKTAYMKDGISLRMQHEQRNLNSSTCSEGHVEAK
jgi:hypothetical protein